MYLLHWVLDPSCGMQDPCHVGSSSLDQGLNPGPLHWEGRVPVTGPLGNPLIYY